MDAQEDPSCAPSPVEDGGGGQLAESQTGQSGTSDVSDTDTGDEKDKVQTETEGDLNKDVDDTVEPSVLSDDIHSDGSGIDSMTVEAAISGLNVDHEEENGGLDMRRDDNIEGAADDGGNRATDLNGNVEKDPALTVRQLMEITKDQVEFGSEKSFASVSDTDSSVLAEAVVKTAISKAVNVMKAGEVNIDNDIEPEHKPDIQVPQCKGDIKVGLFQYQADDYDNGDGDEDDDGGVGSGNVKSNYQGDEVEVEKKDHRSETEDNITQEMPKDSQVGLFSYAEADYSEKSISQEDSEVNDQDNGDEGMDSLNEENNDILKLYGLEDVGPVSPVSPKSASPENDAGNDNSNVGVDGKTCDEVLTGTDMYGQDVVIDVQRQIYEPGTRTFSVNRDPSSSESTPRQTEARSRSDTGEMELDKDNVVEDQSEPFEEIVWVCGDESKARKQAARETRQSPEMEASNIDGLSNQQQGGLDKHAASVSPPLVQYEPVMENGKFRIIKTGKDGGIRVGSEFPVQKSSPKVSPRDSNGDEQATSTQLAEGVRIPQQNKISPRDNEYERKPEKLEMINNQDQKQSSQNGKAVSDMLDSDPSIDIDTSKIRELIAKESKIIESSKTKDRDIGKELIARGPVDDPSEQNDHSPNEMSVADQDNGRESPQLRHEDAADISRSRDSEQKSEDFGDSERLQSDSRYLDLSGQEQSYFRGSYNKDEGRPADCGRASSYGSTSYERELLRSAYDRVPQRPENPVPAAVSPRAHDTGVIPGFKTLHQQQARWTDMFHMLEADHRRELRSQYDRHQFNIQHLQQQMEHELQKQHLAIRKKLDIHKEALANMSPEKESTSRRHGSPETSRSSDRRSAETRSRSRDRSDERSASDDIETLRSSFESRSWREIYQEVREEEERSPSPPRPLRRSLDAELDKSADRARPLGQQRSSQKGQKRSTKIESSSPRLSPHDFQRLANKGQGSDERSPEDYCYYKIESERGQKSREQTPERRQRQDAVSEHVQELLDSLTESRHSLQRGVEASERDRPRAGVYSSPMPLPHGQKTESTRELSINHSSSPAHHGLSGDRAELYNDGRVSRYEDRPLDVSQTSTHSDDSYMSHSTRMNLREKHSKHLSDLRAYYEDELRELRRALSSTLDSNTATANLSAQSSLNHQLLDAENKHLLDKCRSLEDELDEYHLKVRNLEQKLTGVEKRASEYAAAFTDSQTMAVQHRAHIEELQRYCRERDDLILDLESKVTSAEDNAKIYKKNMEEEMELHRQDKTGLQRMVDRYESLESEYKLLQETMTATENKLYESRTELVELNRTLAKMELDNKRLGRENDNLRHKVTQSINLSQLHDSFGSPPSPRDGRQQKRRPMSPTQTGLPNPAGLQSLPTDDRRTPGFATSVNEWSASAQKSKIRSSSGLVNSRSSRGEADLSLLRQQDSGSYTDLSTVHKTSMSSNPEEKIQGRLSQKTLKENSSVKQSREVSSLSREDVSFRRQPRQKTAPEQQRRAKTPPRSISPASQADSEVSDYSPLLKAERELFKLRDMMRHAVSVKPSISPAQPKIQKKFYGSERPLGKEEFTPDLGQPHARKDKAAKTQHSNQSISSSVPKSKSSLSQPRSEKIEKSSQRNQQKSSTYRDEQTLKSKDKVSVKHSDRQGSIDRSEKGSVQNGREYNTSTRFDIDINEDRKTLTVFQRKTDDSLMKRRNLEESQPPQITRVPHDVTDDCAQHHNLIESNDGIKKRETSRQVSDGFLKRHNLNESTVRQSKTHDEFVNQLRSREKDNQSRKERGRDQSNEREDSRQSSLNGTSQGKDEVENTLAMMRGKQSNTGRDWENVHTSMVKPANTQAEKHRLIEQRVRERLQAITEMELRYDGLQAEKMQLESSINKIPLHGRVDRQSRQHKEELEERLDSVVKELGSLRMSLKRYNVLKTTG